MNWVSLASASQHSYPLAPSCFTAFVQKQILPYTAGNFLLSVCSQGNQGNYILTSVWTMIGLNNCKHSSVELIASRSNGDTLQDVVFFLITDCNSSSSSSNCVFALLIQQSYIQ